uniref:Thaumatin-like protein n=1 Tax=Acrobeloides nanus TaxID=290746 RepID=A0A914C3R7_9BILA
MLLSKEDFAGQHDLIGNIFDIVTYTSSKGSRRILKTFTFEIGTQEYDLGNNCTLLTFVEATGGPIINVFNKCPFDIWPGVQGKPLVAGGDRWKNGKIWARRNCNSNMVCDSGSCGPLECNGSAGEPPVSLVEVSLFHEDKHDLYYVSLLDGYNLPVFIEPVPGSYNKSGGENDCVRAGGCFEDVLLTALEELKVYKNGNVASVKSACMKFNTDEYCCRKDFGTKERCNPSNWTINYTEIFKRGCPHAFTYSFDDNMSKFTCRGSSGRTSPDYTVQFC